MAQIMDPEPSSPAAAVAALQPTDRFKLDSSKVSTRPSGRARPLVGLRTAAATLCCIRPSATANARADRSVARARVAVEGARPRAMSEPTQPDTSAAVIDATGQVPKRG
jgi:hypothetical protein